MVRYQEVTIGERREFQTNTSIGGRVDDMSIGNGVDDMSIGDDAGSGLASIIADSNEPRSRCGPKRKLEWKTEWLVYNFYARCNISMKRIAVLFSIGKTLVHDIVYAWANVLCITLVKFFLMPTRSQMLRAYPKSVVKLFGHANIYALLEATELGAQTASMKTVNTIFYSAYKHGSTMKWLAVCCPIGSMADGMISTGHGELISNPIATTVLTILKSLPFGMAVEIDKDVLIENMRAMLGIVCIRPMKMINKQMQQSSPDAGLTQKVGKSRIVIEQCNGRMK